MSNCVGWISGVHLRIQRRNFDRQVYNRKQLGIAAQWIGPIFGFVRKFLQQVLVTRGVFVRLRFTYDGFSQQIDRKRQPLLAELLDRSHRLRQIGRRDKSASHPA